MPNSSNWNAEFVYQTACKLAETAVTEQQKLTTEIKPDNSIVTQADKLVENMAIQALSDATKNISVIGEETIKELSENELNDALAGNCYIIDPIDGTVPYASLIPLWGISIGYAENGEICEGCIVLPGTFEAVITKNGKTYYAKGKGQLPAFNELTEVSPHLKDNCEHPSRVLVINQLTAKTKTITGLTRGVTTYYSIVFPFIYLTLGRMAGIYASLHVWDAAAGMAILRNLGFYAGFADGQPAIYKLTEDFDFSQYKKGHARSREIMVYANHKSFCDSWIECIH
ncbi:inositol monophosphatase family protein [Catenovulum sediminis]|uniref:inositol monophosphatase family protein n=1 Tax=Catenovulum sediminis TaxID=1740262 RepID=UPI00117CBA5E|nr:inositol monophosphatase family protein [Catenovulum sediminis]